MRNVEQSDKPELRRISAYFYVAQQKPTACYLVNHAYGVYVIRDSGMESIR